VYDQAAAHAAGIEDCPGVIGRVRECGRGRESVAQCRHEEAHRELLPRQHESRPLRGMTVFRDECREAPKAETCIIGRNGGDATTPRDHFV
jgi:hypothetical protein